MIKLEQQQAVRRCTAVKINIAVAAAAAIVPPLTVTVAITALVVVGSVVVSSRTFSVMAFSIGSL